jgi:hypothetical protein
VKVWDTRVVFLVASQRWWWNAWRASTSTELYGFAGSREEAWQALEDAIAAAEQPTDLDERRPGRNGGAA